MAVAKYWDAEWEIYPKIDDLYAYMKDKRGYDSMDEFKFHKAVPTTEPELTIRAKVTKQVRN